MKTKQQEWINDHLARGLCRSCTAPSLPGHTRCAEHMDKNRAAQRAFFRKRQGLPPDAVLKLGRRPR